MEYTFRTNGVCATQITFEINEEGIVNNVRFQGGCNGNTQGVAALANGRKAETLIGLLSGIDCRGRGTSCPDQLAKAIQEAVS